MIWDSTPTITSFVNDYNNCSFISSMTFGFNHSKAASTLFWSGLEVVNQLAK